MVFTLKIDKIMANLRVRGITISTQNCIQADSCPHRGLGHINKHNSESSTVRTTSRVLIRKLVIYSLVHHPFSPWKSDKKIRKIWKKIKKILAGLRPAPPQRDSRNLCLHLHSQKGSSYGWMVHWSNYIMNTSTLEREPIKCCTGRHSIFNQIAKFAP